MKLDSVRSLKVELREKVVVPIMQSAAIRSLGVPATVMADAPKSNQTSSFGFGVAPTKRKDEFQLAVRVQKRSLEGSKELARIVRAAKGEVDVRYIGEVKKRVPWHQDRQRPLMIGCSIGHYLITAGTLGCFVRAKNDPEAPLMVLSNNHVLANENRGKQGDVVLQPGKIDGGKKPKDVVATLGKFISLRKTKNQVDAAVAIVKSNIQSKENKLKGILGNLKGLGDDFLDEGLKVAKIGRTTGLTRGSVTAFELDDVWVEFDPHLGDIQFNGQVEIEGQGTNGFSDGGDSGSLIFTEEERKGVALLFAGSDQGGFNNKGLTYANPIHTVFKKLGVELVL